MVNLHLIHININRNIEVNCVKHDSGFLAQISYGEDGIISPELFAFELEEDARLKIEELKEKYNNN